jgi:uncharacterized protein (TIGR02996 family)
MTTRDGLLQAIIGAPDDDASRLVYADFLEETGGDADVARAELIRFQIETARLPDSHPDKPGRVERAVRMTDRRKTDWFGWVRHEDCLPYPERGFLSHWSCGKEDGHRDDLADAFRYEPITDVTLFPNGEDLPALAGWPQLSRLRSLKLWPGSPREEDVLAFLSSPHLSGLRELEYMGQRGTRVSLAGACRLLATLPQFAELSSLSITSAGVGDVGAAAFAASTTLTSLRILVLGHCGLGLAGCRALLGSSVVAGLTNLNLGGNLRRAADGETLAGMLAGSSHLDRLECLILDGTPVNERAAGRLARARWPAMKSLTLLPHDLGDTPAPTGLATMTAAGLRPLAASPWFTRLEHLNLSGHPIGDAGAAILADSRLSHLRHLTLMMIGLTAAGLGHLVGAYSGQLRLLQLYGNPLGDEGARVLAAAEWPQMAARQPDAQVGLLLGGCDIGDAGAAALLASETIPESIPGLFLGRSLASPETLAALAEKYREATIRFGS